jgi:hypothetical protein
MPRIYFTADAPSDVSWLERTPGRAVAYRTKGQPFDVTFVPFARIVGERYGLYWPVLPAVSEERAALDAENAARAFLRRARPGSGGADAGAAAAEHARLVADPRLRAHREPLDLALAGILVEAGRRAEAAKLLEPHTAPFVRRDLAPRIEALLGAPKPSLSGAKPLLVAADAWDGSHLRDERDGRPCIRTDIAARKGHIYFSLPAASPVRGMLQDAAIEVEYWSDGAAGRRFLVEYDGAGPAGAADARPYSASAPVDVPADRGWRRAKLLCARAVFSGRQNAGSDFRLNALGTGDLLVSDVRVSADPAWAKEVFAPFDRLEEGALDIVLPGDEAGEKAHALEAGKGNAGRHLGRGWRDAPDRFGWTLATCGAEGLVLACVYWGGDVGRVFDVTVNGKAIATQELRSPKPGCFILAEYPIPDGLSRGKKSLEVRFVSRSGLAGGVFGCSIRKAD